MADDRAHSMHDDVAASYDAVPYRGQPFWQSHPEWIASIAKLFALPAAPVDRCRVLELGCGDGANLLPMAMDFPGSQFVGIDISPVQVAMGNRDVAKLSLRNLQFLAEDILDFKADLGQFDYVICHGVFSWVPDVVRDKMLRVISDHLSPQGIAFVSYNTKPGWHMRGVIRDMMRFRTRRTENPAERIKQAKAILEFVAENAAGFLNEAYRALLREEARVLRSAPDHYLFHEHLEDNSHAFYFHEFAELLEKASLSYICDSNLASLSTAGLSDNANAELNRIAGNLMEREQYLDFLRNRPFRQSLIRRRDGQSANYGLSADRLNGLYFSCAKAPASRLTPMPGTPVSFTAPGGQTISSVDPFLTMAMMILANEYPGRLRFESLLEKTLVELSKWNVPIGDSARAAPRLGVSLLTILTTFDALRLSTDDQRFTLTASAKPAALPVARLEAAAGQLRVSNGRHESTLLQPGDAELLALLDGNHDHAEIARRLGRSLDEIARQIARLARSALILR